MNSASKPYDGDAQGDGHLDRDPREEHDLELAARDRAAEHAGVCLFCGGVGEVRCHVDLPFELPYPAPITSAPCPRCHGDGAA